MSFPCSSCTALCCGPVALSPNRLDIISGYLATLPPERINALRRQKRGRLTCKFVDMKTNQCAIYPVRPEICRLFGSVEKMICPKVGSVVNPVVQIVADMNFNKEYQSGVGIRSTDFEYPTDSHDHEDYRSHEQ